VRLGAQWRLQGENIMYRSFLLATAAGVAILSASTTASAQTTDSSGIDTITVTAQTLSAARSGIQTQLGASTYTVTADDIKNQPGGDNSLLNQVILQMPDVVQDSFGQFHIILPEGISVFGQTLDPRLAQSVELITGALPAEYGLDTGGVVDIETKTGLFDSGGHISTYGGSHNTFQPSIDYGGS
jgi:outer membrane receptor for ferrienterochelin and colicins